MPDKNPISLRLPEKIPLVDDVILTKSAGPWKTKADGKLRVHTVMSLVELERFTAYDSGELTVTPQDIRGIRLCSVHDIPEGRVCGMEFHRIRKELFVVTEGVIECVCEDLCGGQRTFKLVPYEGMNIPPFIIHTITALEENSGFMYLANTLFDSSDSSTHDTYSREIFEEMKKLVTR